MVRRVDTKMRPNIWLMDCLLSMLRAVARCCFADDDMLRQVRRELGVNVCRSSCEEGSAGFELGLSSFGIVELALVLSLSWTSTLVVASVDLSNVGDGVG